MKKIKRSTIIILIEVLLTAAVFSEEIIIKDIIPGRVFIMDREGCIYTNPDDNSISKYSPEGKFILKFGQKGEGASDIKRLGRAEINPFDSVIYVTEFFGGNKWISKFSTDGKYLGEWQGDIDKKLFLGISTIKFDNGGNTYLQVSKLSTTRRVKDFDIENFGSTVIQFSPTGKKLKEIYTFNSDITVRNERSGKGNLTIPFQNFLFWTVYEDKIIVGETHADFVSVFSTLGNLEKKISLPFKKEKITAKDIDDWENQMKERDWMKKATARGMFDLKYWMDRIPFPEYKPLTYGNIMVDSHGYLYNQKYGSPTWVKTDLSSGKSSLVTFPQEGSFFYIWKDYFFFWQEDEDENVIIKKIHEKELFKTQ